MKLSTSHHPGPQKQGPKNEPQKHGPQNHGGKVCRLLHDGNEMSDNDWKKGASFKKIMVFFTPILSHNYAV